MSAVLRENTTADSASIILSPSIASQPFPPIQIDLLGRIAREWEIVQPLLITIERDDNSFIASDDVFIMYGLGDNIVEAVQDYVTVLIEYYEVLSSHRDAASAALFSQLQTYLRRIRK